MWITEVMNVVLLRTMRPLMHGAKPGEHKALISKSLRRVISPSLRRSFGLNKQKVSKIDTVFNMKYGEWSSVV
jgi:hypothetical protein